MVALSSLAHMYSRGLSGQAGMEPESALVCVQTSITLLDNLRGTMEPFLTSLARAPDSARAAPAPALLRPAPLHPRSLQFSGGARQAAPRAEEEAPPSPGWAMRAAASGWGSAPR